MCLTLRRLLIGCSIVLAGATSGCDMLTGPIVRLRIAELEHGPQVPDAATVGEPLEITITTVVGGCWGRGHTVVEQPHSLIVILKPYDLLDVDRGTQCPASLQPAYHLVSVTFQETGVATVITEAVDWPTGEPVTYTNTVIVK